MKFARVKYRRIKHLPPYQLGVVVDLMKKARRNGEDIINLGMGNPDLPTPKRIVEKLKEAADKPKNHRYSMSQGIPKLREAISNWYERRFGVQIDPSEEAVVTIGAKEGLSHLMFAVTRPGDTVLVPDPGYPIHQFAAVIAGAKAVSVRIDESSDLLANIEKAFKKSKPRARVLILNFPSNPTTQVVDLDFFKEVVKFAKKNKILIIHDFVYADFIFDGYKAPSIFQVPGAKDVAVEITSLSKSYSMPGWRVGFVCGNHEVVAALAKLKSYMDYGMFQPIQIASTVALNHSEESVKEIIATYKRRRDVLCDGLNRIGWKIERPKATMFAWARIPEKHINMGSMAFTRMLLEKGKVGVSPGVGFGKYGEGYVRFALVENEHRIRQAIRGIKKSLS